MPTLRYQEPSHADIAPTLGAVQASKPKPLKGACALAWRAPLACTPAARGARAALTAALERAEEYWLLTLDAETVGHACGCAAGRMLASSCSMTPGSFA